MVVGLSFTEREQQQAAAAAADICIHAYMQWEERERERWSSFILLLCTISFSLSRNGTGVWGGYGGMGMQRYGMGDDGHKPLCKQTQKSILAGFKLPTHIHTNGGAIRSNFNSNHIISYTDD